MSAYAFTEATKALLAVQRPYIFVIAVVNHESTILDSYVNYTIINYGGVPAIVEHLYVGIQESTRAEPDNPPIRIDHAHEMAKDPILIPQVRRELREEYPLGLSNSERERFFQVRIEYRGIFTQSHVTVATWRFDRFSESFVPFHGPQYWDAT